jgi:integrase/recombinase XerD
VPRDGAPQAVHDRGFYRYAVEEELLEHSPAADVRRSRLDYESHAVGLDRNELGALLVAAGLGPPVEHALISLLALNGLRAGTALGMRLTDNPRLPIQIFLLFQWDS